jgi:hypothetical protein
VLLSVAAVFLGLAIVFGLLAFFRATTQPTNGQTVPSPVPVTVTPPVGGTSGVNGPTPVITMTVYVDMPPTSGSGLAGAEALASTLGTVIAAICAVIALRPQGRARPVAAEPPVTPGQSPSQ